MKVRPSLTTAELRHVDLLERVINAISYDWPPGLAYMAVLDYCARQSKHELLELVRARRHLQRRLGVHIYCLARAALKSDPAILAWTSMPAVALGGRRPQDLVATTTGAQRVERLLRLMAKRRSS